MVTVVPTYLIRYAYYAFIITLPFEMAEVTIGGLPLARVLGLLFLATTVLRPRHLYRRPPKAFWCFAIYIFVASFSAINVIMAAPQSGEFIPEIISSLFTRLQLLIFFWLSFNLLASQEVVKGTILSLIFSCVVLAMLQVLGITSEVGGHGRESAFGGNPNTLSAVLSFGLLGIIGLAYGRKEISKKVQLLAWATSAVLLLTIVRTGSRGSIIALALAIVALTVKPHQIREKVKAGAIAVLVIIALVWASFSIDAVRQRWEKTYYEGDLAGRDVIFPAAWGMFLEKPMIGWGPIIHFYELGSRLGREKRDPHNLYLWLFIETGIVGAAPYLAGLWLCFRSAWRARILSNTTLPLAMMLLFFGISLKGTWLTQKILWVVLAYALASGAQRVSKPVRRPLQAMPLVQRTPAARRRIPTTAVRRS